MPQTSSYMVEFRVRDLQEINLGPGYDDTF